MNFDEQRLTLTNGQQINYIQINKPSKTVILFIHGNFSSWIWWKDVIEVLNHQKYRIIALDQRGFGKSSYNNPVIRLTTHAQDIIDFCKIKQLKNVVLVGWSYGGGVAMKAAQLAPQIFTKIIPSASICHKGLIMVNDKGQQCKSKDDFLALPKIKFVVQILNTKNFQVQMNIYNAVLFPKMKDYPEQKKALYVKTSFQQAAYLDLLTTLGNSDINIDKISSKVLMIHGRDDLVIKAETIQQTFQRLSQHNKNSLIQVWPDFGHMLPVEDPKRFVLRIQKFIDLSE